MLNKLKQIKFTKKGVYISLAICMLLVGCIGIYSSVKNMNKIIEESDFEYDDTPAVTDVLPKTHLDVSMEKEVINPVTEEKNILSFTMPVDGQVSKNFSNNDLVYSETMNDYRTHNGIDIAIADGTAVCSSEAGTISSVEKHPLWGNCITVEHANGITTCYKNLANDLPVGIEKGGYVTRGGVIGTVGSTALVEIGEQSHLHFEMYANGEPVNPLDYFE